MEKQINLTGGVIYNQDCLKGLKEIKDNQFDVAITSPPYNRVRNDKYAHYDDVKNNYYKMIVDVTNELLRVCKKDVIVNIQATYFNKKDVYKYIGYFADKLKGIVIWEKTNPQPSINKIKDENGNILTSVCNAVEYFFVLNEQAEEFRAYGSIKNIVHSSVNEKQHRDIAFFGVEPNFKQVLQPYKNPNDKRIKKRIEEGKLGCKLYDWWNVNQVKNVSKVKTKHPCQMPLEVMKKVVGILPKDSIIIDPFMGSGTTGVACKELGYEFIGCEIDSEYFGIAKERLEEIKLF